MTDPKLAPENQPGGDWRAAFGSLRTEVASLEAEVRSVNQQLAGVVSTLDRIGGKVDAVGTAQAGMQYATGRISAQLILGMIAVMTPIILAAAGLGHVFVKNTSEHLGERIALLSVEAARAQGTADATAESLNIYKQAAAADLWTKSDQNRFQSGEITDLRERIRELETSVARADERVRAQPSTPY